MDLKTMLQESYTKILKEDKLSDLGNSVIAKGANEGDVGAILTILKAADPKKPTRYADWMFRQLINKENKEGSRRTTERLANLFPEYIKYVDTHPQAQKDINTFKKVEDLADYLNGIATEIAQKGVSASKIKKIEKTAGIEDKIAAIPKQLLVADSDKCAVIFPQTKEEAIKFCGHGLYTWCTISTGSENYHDYYRRSQLANVYYLCIKGESLDREEVKEMYPAFWDRFVKPRKGRGGKIINYVETLPIAAIKIQESSGGKKDIEVFDKCDDSHGISEKCVQELLKLADFTLD